MMPRSVSSPHVLFASRHPFLARAEPHLRFLVCLRSEVNSKARQTCSTPPLLPRVYTLYFKFTATAGCYMIRHFFLCLLCLLFFSRLSFFDFFEEDFRDFSLAETKTETGRTDNEYTHTSEVEKTTIVRLA